MFFLRKLNRLKLNYPIYNKEFFIIIFYFKKFKYYLIGGIYKVKVYIDYKNIIYFAII